MKKLLTLALLVAALSVSAFAQELNSKGQPVVKIKDNAPVELKTGEKITRGAALTGAKKVSLEKALKNPAKYAGKTVAVEGVIVRACKKEGCWMQLAPTADSKGVRVTFGDHAFFVPLNSAGLMAKAEGTLSVKTLSKEEVDHLVNDDGDKFDKINPDGTVTEVSFVATGVELTKK